MTEMKVHPVADLFPMMSETELQDLAADIKAKGLIQPILTTGGMLLDGRNRLRACEIAGVEPTFAEMNGIADPLGFVVSLNVKRRKLQSGQLAISAARAWAYAEAEGLVATKGGDRKSKAHSGHLIQHPRDHFAAMFGVGKNYVEQARALLKDDPPAAAIVEAGGATLKEKYDALVERQRESMTAEARMTKLREQAPDLAEQVAEERLALTEAYAAFEQRIKDAVALEQNRRETMIRVAEDSYRGIMGMANVEFIADLRARLSDDEFRRLLKQRMRLNFGPASEIEIGANALVALINDLEDKQ